MMTESWLHQHTCAHVHRPARVLKCSPTILDSWCFQWHGQSAFCMCVCACVFLLHLEEKEKKKNSDTCSESPECVTLIRQREDTGPVLAVIWSHRPLMVFRISAAKTAGGDKKERERAPTSCSSLQVCPLRFVHLICISTCQPVATHSPYYIVL